MCKNKESNIMFGSVKGKYNDILGTHIGIAK